MGFRALPNTLGVFWGYKPTANGPPGSAEHTQGVLGLHIPANGSLGSTKPNRGVLGLQIPRQWALGFRRTQLLYFRVPKTLPMGPRFPPNTLGVFWG
ncbi:Hypothetical protein FKW44_003557 [Caligus rogercresseyi]|uniref:Uncharacterized protein n=1 Tax=Caligus rogercresseyi TaxID=217165 RepID=A0A7T8KLS4_CALRO|nr:Hypothetical protein FKW44_003557 [Caligus rogercresseyi]